MSEEMQARRVIGLDAHPYLFSAAALAGTDARLAEVQWVVDRLPLERLEDIIRKRVAPQDVVVLESSANSFSIVERIARCGRTALVLESQAVGRQGKPYCATDKVDAIKIARVYLGGTAPVVWTPDAQAAGRRELFFSHRNAVRDAVRARNRIWAWCNEHNLCRVTHLRLTRSDALARLLALKPWTELQRVILADLIQTFQQAEERRARLRALIAEEVARDPQVLKLIRLLGVRHLVAFALVAFIGQIERFANPRKLVAYIGLNPGVSRSGNNGGTGGLSHYGRADVRGLLIQAAQSILRYGQGQTHHWAVALKMRKGTNVAVAALARKLLVAVWYLLRGFFTPLTDISNSLSIKMHKIATEIGVQRIRKLGFKSAADFENQKLELLLQTS